MKVLFTGAAGVEKFKTNNRMTHLNARHTVNWNIEEVSDSNASDGKLLIKAQSFSQGPSLFQQL